MRSKRDGGVPSRDLTVAVQLKRRDLVHVLNAGLTTIDQWLASGELPSYRIGGTVFVHRDDALAFVERHRIGQLVYQTAS